LKVSVALSLRQEGIELKIVAAIPAFNEEATIAKVIAHALDHVDEILVLDDGSQDDTSLIAGKMGAVVLKHEKNLGKGAAVRDCFDWARRNGADVLVTLYVTSLKSRLLRISSSDPSVSKQR
jgi:glycosyltransferase involved in cell wall biosynthesis